MSFLLFKFQKPKMNLKIEDVLTQIVSEISDNKQKIESLNLVKYMDFNNLILLISNSKDVCWCGNTLKYQKWRVNSYIQILILKLWTYG